LKSTYLLRIGGNIGLEEYLAPEVLNRGHTGFSDIFAWAQLVVDVIRSSYSKLADDQGGVKFPAKLMAIVKDCLSDEPEERYTSDELVVLLEQLGEEFTSGDASDVEWTEGSFELPQVARRLSSSLQLPSSWFKPTQLRSLKP
jgi:hypothetical protein